MTKFLQEKLEEKKDKLMETYEALKKLQKLSLKNLKEQKENFWAVNYGLVIGIEAILDIGQYVLSDKKLKAETYSRVIPLLAQEKVLPKKYAETVQGMVNFRNIAIHNDPSLDESLVYEFLQNNLDDFKKFLKYINDYAR